MSDDTARLIILSVVLVSIAVLFNGVSLVLLVGSL